jgi:hypothetical protein
MATEFPKGSMGEQDVKNNKLASKICIAAFVVAHLLCYVLSNARFVQVGKYPFLWAVPVLCIVALVFTVKNLLKGSEVTELSPWPYIALIATTFFSCMVLFWCAAC